MTNSPPAIPPPVAYYSTNTIEVAWSGVKYCDGKQVDYFLTVGTNTYDCGTNWFCFVDVTNGSEINIYATDGSNNISGPAILIYNDPNRELDEVLRWNFVKPTDVFETTNFVQFNPVATNVYYWVSPVNKKEDYFILKSK